MSVNTGRKKKPQSTPPIPQGILNGQIPLAERYRGKWQPVKSNTRPATAVDLAEVTAEGDEAMAEALAGIVLESKTDARMVWFGKVYEFAQFIKNAHDQGHFGNISPEKAFRQASEHYVQSDGKPFSTRSLRESLRQVDNKANGKVRA
jgi:hypothetical protein